MIGRVVVVGSVVVVDVLVVDGGATAVVSEMLTPPPPVSPVQATSRAKLKRKCRDFTPGSMDQSSRNTMAVMVKINSKVSTRPHAVRRETAERIIP